MVSESQMPCQRYLEYIVCISCRVVRHLPQKREGCPGYDSKLSDGEAPVLELWGNVEYSIIVITPRSTLTWSGSSC